MPDGNAQRPAISSLHVGQTSRSQHRAEGRLVLADVLWYVQDRFKPQFMVNLATLTGAIVVALGRNMPGCFPTMTNFRAASMPPGRRQAKRSGACRSARIRQADRFALRRHEEFRRAPRRLDHRGAVLQRFVNDTPWAHLDIAGTALGSPSTETNRSWGAGWGVRLLNQLVAEHYEG